MKLKQEKKKLFLLRSGTRQGGPLSQLLIDIVLKVLDTTSDKKKKQRESKLQRKKQNCHCVQMT